MEEIVIYWYNGGTYYSRYTTQSLRQIKGYDGNKIFGSSWQVPYYDNPGRDNTFVALFFDDTMTNLDTTNSKFFEIDYPDNDIEMLNFEVMSSRYVHTFVSDRDNRFYITRFDI